MRINARLDEDHEDRITYLIQATGSTVTDVVKQAIDFYYEAYTREHPGGRALLQSGFVGIADGEADLSVNYKALLTDDLGRKHGHR